MRRIIGLILLCATLFPALAEMPYRTALRKADDHFANEEWREAIAMYDLLLERRPSRVKTYVDAVVSSAMLNDSSSVMAYVVRSEKQGVSLDSLFSGVDACSRAIGHTAVYEQVLLLVKKEQPWFTRVANNYLLGYYSFRRDAHKMIAIADELLAVMPDHIGYLRAKAEALLLLGAHEKALAVQQSILKIDSLDFDANVFMGCYYAMKGREKLDSIDERYLGGEDNLPASVRKKTYTREKQTIIDTDIARAKRYFSTASHARGNKYLSEQLASLSSLTADLPVISSGIILPVLKRSK